MKSPSYKPLSRRFDKSE